MHCSIKQRLETCGPRQNFVTVRAIVLVHYTGKIVFLKNYLTLNYMLHLIGGLKAAQNFLISTKKQLTKPQLMKQFST